MEIIRTPKSMQQRALGLRHAGIKLGFVPTMGYLHEGHLSLVRLAREQSDQVAVSIFVNPTQFGPQEDLDRYPRDFERDCELLRSEGVEILFAPQKEDLYGPNHTTEIHLPNLTGNLCGASRPWHFPGVALIVAKLFNLVLPTSAVFGQKDFQQALVIKQLVRDLDFPLQVVVGPIVREEDGLAMSSRNRYLSASERDQATVLVRSLRAANRAWEEGVRKTTALEQVLCEVLAEAPLGQVDYAEVVTATNLTKVGELSDTAVALVAVQFGSARLIDNHVLGEALVVRNSG